VLTDTAGPVVAVSDWMRAVPDLIRPWVPTGMVTLGTDGFGPSDTRPAARRHFLVDAESITVAALLALARRGEVDPDAPRTAKTRYRLDDPTAAGPQTSDPGVA
jgi:pyruvate dehydrogenase E1 component